MRIPVMLSYSHESKEVKLNFDLHASEDQTRIIKTLTWAANKRVNVVIQPLVTVEQTQAA